MGVERIFVAHGRDLLARDSVAHVVQSLGLEPVFLSDSVLMGHTWIDGLESVSHGVSFAVVIYRADDRGWLAGDPHGVRPRVRQNVLFELGFMIGRLGREKVCVLYEEGVDIPSDFEGARFVKLAGESEWKVNLAITLQQAGFEVDPARVLKIESRMSPPDQEIIRDPIARTEQIIRDLEALAHDTRTRKREVRFADFLSAFAIGYPDEMARRSDAAVLLRERDALLRLARESCSVFCIVAPPALAEDLQRSAIARWRVLAMLEFLRSKDPALKNIFWAIAPTIENYVYVIGHISFLQGFKGDDSLRGFVITERRTAMEELSRQTLVFNERFRLHSEHTLRKYGTEGALDQRDALRMAVVKCLESALGPLANSDDGGSGAANTGPAADG